METEWKMRIFLNFFVSAANKEMKMEMNKPPVSHLITSFSFQQYFHFKWLECDGKFYKMVEMKELSVCFLLSSSPLQ